MPGEGSLTATAVRRSWCASGIPDAVAWCWAKGGGQLAATHRTDRHQHSGSL